MYDAFEQTLAYETGTTRATHARERGERASLRESIETSGDGGDGSDGAGDAPFRANVRLRCVVPRVKKNASTTT